MTRPMCTACRSHFSKIALDLLLAALLDDEQHALLRLRQHDLVRRHPGLALRHVRHVDLDADAAARAHLAGGAREARGAHVLDADERVGPHHLEACLEQELLDEGVSHLHGNPLVNVFCLGIARADEIVKGVAQRPSATRSITSARRPGRDGIHGATMASAEFDEKSEEKRPTVQVGDPFIEKLLLEACLEVMKTDALVGIQDMGAAGLTCSTCEMAARGGSGHRDRRDRRAAARERHDAVRDHAVRIAGAHAARRQAGREEEVERIFEKWDLDAVPSARSPTTACCA